MDDAMAPGIVNYVCEHSAFVQLQIRDAGDEAKAAEVLNSWCVRDLPTYAVAAFGPDDYFSTLPAATSEVIEDRAGPRIWFDYKDALSGNPALAQTIVSGLAQRVRAAGLTTAVVDWPRTPGPQSGVRLRSPARLEHQKHHLFRTAGWWVIRHTVADRIGICTTCGRRQRSPSGRPCRCPPTSA